MGVQAEAIGGTRRAKAHGRVSVKMAGSFVFLHKIFIIKEPLPTVTGEVILTRSSENCMKPCPTEQFLTLSPRLQSHLTYRWGNQGDVMPKSLQNVTMFPQGCK